MQDMRRIILLLLTVLFSESLHAQESQYEQMKSLLDENSLPLVNLTVDISTVNRTDYVQGEIEITTGHRSTDLSAEI